MHFKHNFYIFIGSSYGPPQATIVRSTEESGIESALSDLSSDGEDYLYPKEDSGYTIPQPLTELNLASAVRREKVSKVDMTTLRLVPTSLPKIKQDYLNTEKVS